MEAATTVPRLSWPDFLDAFHWEQGEHVTLIARTKGGKTTLARELLATQPYAAFFATKPKGQDPVVEELRREGFVTVRDWTPISDPELTPRVVLEPGLPNGEDSLSQQSAAFRNAIRGIHRQGGWTVCVDEGLYMVQELGLSRPLELLWYQGRSGGVSLIFSTQRPRNVPLLAYDQATHIFLWKNADRQHLDRLSEIAGAFDAETIRRELPQLGPHEILYVNTWTGQLARTRVEL